MPDTESPSVCPVTVPVDPQQLPESSGAQQPTTVLDLTNSHLKDLATVVISSSLQVLLHNAACSRNCIAHILQSSCCKGAAIFCNRLLVLVDITFSLDPLTLLQTLDLTANRLTEFDPRILALTGECRRCVWCFTCDALARAWQWSTIPAHCTSVQTTSPWASSLYPFIVQDLP